MISIYDCMTDSYISAKNKAELSKKIGVHHTKLVQLTTNLSSVLSNRYTNLKENCFILKEIGGEKRFICADAKSFFKHLNSEYHENTSKYISSLLRGKQNKFLFKNIYYELEKMSQKTPKRTERFKNGYNKLACPIRINNNKISVRIRNRVRTALKRQFIKKRKKTLEYIGCSIEFLIGWLESKFENGMSWENYGDWHIDHIKPCNTFNFENEDEIHKCFHYSNIRPLWALENLSRPKDGSDILS